MNGSIISQLVIKDLLLWRRLILIFCAASFVCVGLLAVSINRVPSYVLINLGFTLLITPTGTLGIVLLMQSNVFEKAKSTQQFIMSLPVTLRQFTIAKLLFNVPIFTAVWLMTMCIAFYFAFGLRQMPIGSLPYATIVFLGVFDAYIGILCVSLLSQSLGVTIIAIMVCELVTSAYLWALAYLDPIQNFLYGPRVVWNATALTVLFMQVFVAILAIWITLLCQSRKRDFV